MDETVEMLSTLAREALGSASELSIDLAAARGRYAEIRDTRNERSNYRDSRDPNLEKDGDQRDRINRGALKLIAAATDPIDEASLIKAVDEFNNFDNKYDLNGFFFGELRNKVPYDGRAKYVVNVAGLENLLFYWKFAELKKAREAWDGSSAALTDVYAEIAYRVINAHAEDLVSDGSLSGYDIKQISDVTGVPIPDLIIELIKVFARPDSIVSGSVWVGFATFICPEADAGQGQLALKRLLSSDAARLADSVADGRWARGLYPPDEFAEIAAGIVWRVLGSADATDRWRAAHCLRLFAKFGRWEVIDNVVTRSHRLDAGPFQARELPFFYMHARLWLLIALARMGIDFPAEVARYKDDLLTYVLEDKDPHVLMRHFAGRALQTCMDARELKLAASTQRRVREADRSPHPRLKKKLRRNGGFYSGRPESIPAPSFKFHLDYDFHKMDVDNLSKVFGQPCWMVADMMSEIVHRIDPMVDSMYKSEGRESRYRSASYRMTSRYHTHGQQLGWHALFLAAGRLLKDNPVTDDWLYDEDPWGEWFNGYGLTRDDGLWLSDGTDRAPLGLPESLLERKNKELVITGNREKILALASIRSRVVNELVVQGLWFSADNVRVHISSALVPSRKAATFARELAREEPMSVWVPAFMRVRRIQTLFAEIRRNTRRGSSVRVVGWR